MEVGLLFALGVSVGPVTEDTVSICQLAIGVVSIAVDLLFLSIFAISSNGSSSSSSLIIEKLQLWSIFTGGDSNKRGACDNIGEWGGCDDNGERFDAGGDDIVESADMLASNAAGLGTNKGSSFSTEPIFPLHCTWSLENLIIQ